MSINFSIARRGFARMVYAKAPYIRNKTVSGIEFETKIVTQPKEENKHGLESRQWFLKRKDSDAFISPWHDIELGSTIE